MFSRLSSVAAVALAATVSAQTFSKCDPMEVDPKTCDPNPAFAGTYEIDFTKGESDIFTASAGTTVTYDPTLGAEVVIAQEGQAPTFTSTKYMFFGTVEVTMRVAKGAGIITTIVLESDVLDEIDWEWLGGANGVVQANYFSKGDTTSYGKLEQELAVPGGDDINTFHTYTLDWTPEKLEWKIDGTSLRTLTYAGNENTYPQTPMMVKFGTWCGGCSTAPGTVAWAGGAPDWSQAPFIAYYQNIKITDNAKGVANAKTYEYTDQTGSMASIKINTGSASDANNTDSGDDNDDKDTAATGRVASDAQGTATTLSTATGVINNAAATPTTTDSPLGQSAQVASNSTVTSGSGSGSSARPSSSTGDSSTETGVVTSGAQKSAVNIAFVAAAMFALLSL